MYMKVRCDWVIHGTPIEIQYHDYEWCVPVHDDNKLFEFLVLESAQAGLSWATILKKREGYRKAFDNFDVEKVANYDQRRIQQLIANPAIIRNKLKIRSAVKNATAFVKLQQELGSFDSYIWSFVDGKPKRNKWKNLSEIPSRTEISDALSKDMKKKGFVFVGPTTCYSLMQGIGMVNDHITKCFRYKELLQ